MSPFPRVITFLLCYDMNTLTFTHTRNTTRVRERHEWHDDARYPRTKCQVSARQMGGWRKIKLSCVCDFHSECDLSRATRRMRAMWKICARWNNVYRSMIITCVIDSDVGVFFFLLIIKVFYFARRHLFSSKSHVRLVGENWAIGSFDYYQFTEKMSIHFHSTLE